MDLVNDFKKIVKLFPLITIPRFNKSSHHYYCSKEWFIDIKKVIFESPNFKTDDNFKLAFESVKNLIAHIPFRQNLMFAELEIKKTWNIYKINKESWSFLFFKTPSEIVSIAKNIAYSSQDELMQKKYPFNYENKKINKIKYITNLKQHIYFYKDYKKSYDIFGNYYSKENYALFLKFLDILENFNEKKSQNETLLNEDEKGKAENFKIEEIIKGFRDETINDVKRGINVLGENVSGIPRWGNENLTQLVDTIDNSVTKIFDSVSKALVFPNNKWNKKNTSGLCTNNSILKRVLNLLEENYRDIGDYSPALQAFLEKLKGLLALNKKIDLVFLFTEQRQNMTRKYKALIQKRQEAAGILMEGAEAFDIFSKELESGNEFKISKSWINPNTKRGKLRIYKEDIKKLEPKLNILENQCHNLEEQIQNINHENYSINNDLERCKKRFAEFSDAIDNASSFTNVTLNFWEKLFKHFGINYLSKKRKEKLKEIDTLNLKYISVKKTAEKLEAQLEHNKLIFSKLNSQLNEIKTNKVYLKKEINEINLKLSKEESRILNAKESAAKLRLEASKLNPKGIYHSVQHPWANGIPKIFDKCELSGDTIIQKTKNHIIKDSAEKYEESVKKYIAIGENILSFIVTVQAYGTIYINNCEQNPSCKQLFKTNTGRLNIIKKLDKNISEDRTRLSDLISYANEQKEKVCKL